MKYFLALVAVLVVALGVAGVVYGEGDGSPGLQLVVAVLVIGGVAIGVRLVRRSR
ncbi:hypothetical protein [Micromonospora sp. CPCC 205714]|uniref:hypothetical protein n=1 Tax=Micromonospora sp. CPCC 205714 TaxID=3122402 RepID=UPI002FF00D0C